LVESCIDAEYYDYDGFALVFTWTDNSKPAMNTSLYWGFCLPDNTCIFADPTFSTYDFKQVKLPVVPTTLFPAPKDLALSKNEACAVYKMGFSDECFGWDPT